MWTRWRACLQGNSAPPARERDKGISQLDNKNPSLDSSFTLLLLQRSRKVFEKLSSEVLSYS